MKPVHSIALILGIAVLGVAIIACVPTPTAPTPAPTSAPPTPAPTSAPPTPTVPPTSAPPTQTVAPTPIQVGVPGTCPVPKEGGACRFSNADKDNPVDVTLQVPGQASSLIFTSEKRLATHRPESKIPDNTKIYRNFMGLTVTDADKKPVAAFKPPVTVIVVYPAQDADLAGDAGKLNLYLHTGKSWIPLTMISREPKSGKLTTPTGTLTAVIDTFSQDDLGDGGE